LDCSNLGSFGIYSHLNFLYTRILICVRVRVWISLCSSQQSQARNDEQSGLWSVVCPAVRSLSAIRQREEKSHVRINFSCWHHNKESPRNYSKTRVEDAAVERIRLAQSNSFCHVWKLEALYPKLRAIIEESGIWDLYLNPCVTALITA
jgi:hypothetical protein